MKARSEVAKEDQWKVEAIYPDLKAWKEAFSRFNPEKINLYKGRLGESPAILKEALETILGYERKLAGLYTYVHLKHDEDITENEHKAALGQIQSTLFDFARRISWFEPELIELSDEKQKDYLNSPILREYHFHLEKIFRLKKHTLPHEKEEIVALAMKAMQTPHKAFSAMNDADLSFPEVVDQQGNLHPLTHGSYQVMLRSRDRLLRENAFKSYHKRFEDYENTFAELVSGAVERNVFNAKSHQFSSALDAALYPKNIDTQVYLALIDTVRKNIVALHEYYALREKVLDLKPLHIWDQQVPITPELEIKMGYRDAEETILEAIQPLGSDYLEMLRKGFKEERWVDRYENKNKRSGAYSSGSYDTQPYILMNYKNLLRDVFTLAHEAGHSMHSLLSHKHQPYHYGDYPIFLAEVASTFNEELLSRHLLKKATQKEEKIFLINQKLEDIRATLFRQTMFAEFELKIHQLAEKDTPLTPQKLKEEYLALNEFYYGKGVVVDKEIAIEWARIPHFYYNFYVFQYATGISAALALAERVVTGGETERAAYLSFLKSGCSRYPIDTLKLAGVDMTSEQPVKAAIETFRRLTQELAVLINGC